MTSSKIPAKRNDAKIPNCGTGIIFQSILSKIPTVDNKDGVPDRRQRSGRIRSCKVLGLKKLCAGRSALDVDRAGRRRSALEQGSRDLARRRSALERSARSTSICSLKIYALV